MSWPPTGNLLVTFALEADDAERLVFSMEFGRIWLTYEPADSGGHDSAEMTHRGNVYDHPHEPADGTESAVQPAAAETDTEADAEAEVAS